MSRSGRRAVWRAGWIECFEKAHLTGSVFGGGVTDVGEIKGHHALAEAYEMGKAIR